MNSLNKFNYIPNSGRVLQLIAHPLYITLGTLFFYGFQRPFYYYPLLMLINFIFTYIFMKISNKFYTTQESLYTLTPVITAGNLMLNMEAYSITPYIVAGFFAAISRAFLRTKNGHIFNPGLIGLFTFAMIFPKFGYSSLGLWKSNLSFVMIIILMGHIVVYKARRLRVVYGYVLGFSFFGIFLSIITKLFSLHYNGLEDMPVLFWPSTLLTATSLIYIFHVITDPKTSPSNNSQQFLYGSLIGVIDFSLRISLIIPAEVISYLLVQCLYGFYCAHQDKKVFSL